MQILKHYLSPLRLFTQNNPQKQEFKQKAIEDNSLKIVIVMLKSSSSQLFTYGRNGDEAGLAFFKRLDIESFEHAPVSIWTVQIRFNFFFLFPSSFVLGKVLNVRGGPGRTGT